jgi:NTP pyrophosphatase (non-canonical NTP hydrolase)
MSKFELTFATLRTANRLRLPQFKNAKGLPAHSEPDGSDWPLDAWSNAALGELGEAANLIKKLRRGDFTLDEAIVDKDGNPTTPRQLLASELADVVTYVDILALQIGVSLGDEVAQKFNEVSQRVGADIKIDAGEVGLDHHAEEVVPRVAAHTKGRLVLHSLD